MAKVSVPQAKAKRNRGKPEPVYIPVSDISSEDKLTALRTKYFYLVTEAEMVGREIERLGGGAVCKK
jgi:hypothetical protein